MSVSEFRVQDAIVQLVKGDITEMDVDAIVNAANSSLLGGGGVDGAIHRRGGPKILEECRVIRVKEWPDGLPTGRAVMTSGGLLKAKYIIHAVGPIWHGGKSKERQLLAKAYRSSLELASTFGLKSVAFPSISTGAYGFPMELAGRIALEATRSFLEAEDKLAKVIFVLFSEPDFENYRIFAQEILKPKS